MRIETKRIDAVRHEIGDRGSHRRDREPVLRLDFCASLHDDQKVSRINSDFEPIPLKMT
jgi:hypothetical protein